MQTCSSDLFVGEDLHHLHQAIELLDHRRTLQMQRTCPISRAGSNMYITAHELHRAAECRRWAARWKCAPVWHGSWSVQDWINSARDHLTLAKKLMAS
jgi:hypothetical protein